MREHTRERADALTEAGLVRGLAALASIQLRGEHSLPPARSFTDLAGDLAGAVAVLTTIIATATERTEESIIAEHLALIGLDPLLDETRMHLAIDGFRILTDELSGRRGPDLDGRTACLSLLAAAEHLYPDVVDVSINADTPAQALLDLIGIVTAQH